MWRMSDILSVCLQDFLYSSEPEVRALRVFENLSHASLQLIEERDSSVSFFASIHEFLWCCMFPKAAGKRKQNYDS